MNRMPSNGFRNDRSISHVYRGGQNTIGCSVQSSKAIKINPKPLKMHLVCLAPACDTSGAPGGRESAPAAGKLECGCLPTISDGLQRFPEDFFYGMVPESAPQACTTVLRPAKMTQRAQNPPCSPCDALRPLDDPGAPGQVFRAREIALLIASNDFQRFPMMYG